MAQETSQDKDSDMNLGGIGRVGSMGSMGSVARRLGNGRAIENARSASTELSRRRLQREEVEIFLDRLGAGPPTEALRARAVADL